MTKSSRCASVVLTLPLLLLSGCLFTTRKLPVPKEPTITQTVTPDELVKRLNQRWDAINTFYTNVEIQASALKTKEGVEKDYTTFPGIIMMRKPELLRVYGRVPVIGSRMFDMVSDGKNFTLYIPSRDIAYEGPNSLNKRSPNTVENMRPGFFFDAMVVRGLEPDDDYMVTARYGYHRRRQKEASDPDSGIRAEHPSRQARVKRTHAGARGDFPPRRSAAVRTGSLRQQWKPGNPRHVCGLPDFWRRALPHVRRHQETARGVPTRAHRG